MFALEACVWPMPRAAHALEALVRSCGFATVSVDTLTVPGSFATADSDVQTRWLDTAAAVLGVEVEPVDANYSDFEWVMRHAAPALLKIRWQNTWGWLLLIAGRRRAVSLLTPDLLIRRVSRRAIVHALCEPVEAPVAAETDTLLDDVGVSGARRARARSALLHERLRSTTVASCWLVRLPPGSNFAAQCTRAHLRPRLAALVVARASAYLLWILSWWILGRAALQGHLDLGWLLAWALLVATVIPCELLVTWLQGRISIEISSLLKRRLLHGTLRLEPDEIRHQGSGQLLGRVIENRAIETLALSGGFLALAAAIELAGAGLVLITGFAWLALLLVCWIGVTALCFWQFFKRRKAWSEIRLTMTHDLVEWIVGHRTRLAQGAQDRWHESEDRSLERYFETSRSMDRATVWLSAIASRGWLLLAVATLSWPFAIGSVSRTELAAALAGILLVRLAFRKMTIGASYLADATIAWVHAAPTFDAASRPEPTGNAAFALKWRSSAANGQVLLEGRELSFHHDGRAQPVLHGCNLRVHHGERLLLVGPTGGGKSTLVSLLSGLREPQSGLLLLDGVDRQTLGNATWRRRVVVVPQFHENHIFTDTFAFNVLMGCEWPPRSSDLERAHEICREMGLGDLLMRMPGGLLQRVGETGWQLSHGERSRVFVARGLLQRGELIVLDESLAQLDPENLLTTLQCVLKHANNVIVVTHY